MPIKPSARLALIATLVASFAAGCARVPTGVYSTGHQAGGFSALAKPVSADASAAALKWQKDAVQVGVSISRSFSDADDVATYVFASKHSPKAMLVVANTGDGFKAQEVPLSDNSAAGLANTLPLADPDGTLLDSKILFADAEQAGLAKASDLVVLNSHHGTVSSVMAVVTDEADQNCLLLDAKTGKPLTHVTRLAQRNVQMHELIAAVVVVATLGTVVIVAAKKLLSHFFHPKPKPAPSASPSASPSPVVSAPPQPAGA